MSKNYGKLKLIAAICGSLGFLLALATPFLPIKQQTAVINWPSNGNLENITSPLIAYAPENLSIHIPCKAVKNLPKAGGVVLSTAPLDGRNAPLHALFITATDKNVLISTRNTLVAETSRNLVENGTCSEIVFNSSTQTGQSADFVGIPERPEALKVPLDTQDQYKYTVKISDYMVTPTVVGIFTDLPKNLSTAGFEVKITVDTRFESIPHPIKLFAIYLGIITTIISLICLGILDSKSGHRLRKGIPPRWRKFTFVDSIVFIILLIWWFMGVNTSDDGYQFSMARFINTTGYMPNYFRWLGTPEDPVGWYYHIFAFMLKVSSSALWLRLPALCLGILGWLLISREALPRLGKMLTNTKIPLWAAAAGYLVVWLPYNNGNRPESLATVLMLLSWILAENAIATRRSLPIALALLVAAFSFGAAPGGMVATIGIIVCFRRMLQVVISNCKSNGILTTVMPILAAGTFLLFVSFSDQTIAGVLEASRIKYLYGPSLDWWEELVRYYYLMVPSVDGSVSRRLGVLPLIFFLFTIFFIILRRNRIKGLNRGVAIRFLAVTAGSILFLTITPTKWTHHFGLFATFSGVTAALCSVLVAPYVLRSKRNRMFFTGILVILCGVAFTGRNAYWFMGNLGQPWAEDSPHIFGIQISLILLWLGIIILLLGGFYHLKGEDDKTYSWFSPLALILSAIVIFEMGTTVTGTIRERHSFSWAIDNYRTIKGNKCGMASQILLEPNPNKGFLDESPENKYKNLHGMSLLVGSKPTQFTNKNVPNDATKEYMNEYLLERNRDAFVSEEGTRATNKDNQLLNLKPDNSIKLPFQMNSNRIPTVGTFLFPGTTNLQSHWYKLPENYKNNPLIVVTAAGNIHARNYIEKYGPKEGGDKLELQYAKVNPDGTSSNIGSITPIDIGPDPAWRNLRFPTDEIPKEANSVRIVANDNSVAEGHWIAVTPPRLPELVNLNSYLGSTQPILIDWAVAIAFPCQQPMGLKHGILQVPNYRISPDHIAKFVSTDTWESGGQGGGILGTTDLYLNQYLMSGFMENNWGYDWGYVTKYTPILTSKQSELSLGYMTRTGWWKPGKLRAAKYNEALM